MKSLAIIIVIALIIRVAIAVRSRKAKAKPSEANTTSTPSTDSSVIDVKKNRNNKSLKNQLKTVLSLTKLSTKRFFRDRLAQFFAILFPLIFLFVFGSLNKGGGNISFNVALINESNTVFARNFDHELRTSSTFKIDSSSETLSEAKSKLVKSQIDGIIVLPKQFGAVKDGQKYPSGQVQVVYDENTVSTGQTLVSVLQGSIKSINSKFVTVTQPFTAVGKELNEKGLSQFDYTFSGLLGFSIIGIGIFGPVNVFPELKKQGILRRLHTTPLRVWQYFLSTMLSQAITGIIAIAIQFIVAIKVFDLKINGNYFDIVIFTVLSIFMILGLGLAIGGWAKNERQAAPLSNIVVFPMLFLSGTFFPRYIMPDWLQSVTNYLPLTPVIDGLRLLTTEGKSLFQIGPQLGLMAAWFVIIYFIAFRVFKWE
jgi:ABC-2 type transport system permease protein